MVDPVSSSVFGQRGVLDTGPVNAIVQSEQDTKASLCKDSMRRFEGDVIHAHFEAARRFEVRNSFTETSENRTTRLPLSNGNQARVHRQHGLFRGIKLTRLSSSRFPGCTPQGVSVEPFVATRALEETDERFSTNVNILGCRKDLWVTKLHAENRGRHRC
jgi:hypothetical protein